jgi:hypothetical protein
MNFEVSNMIGNNISAPRIQEAISQLNCIRRVRGRAFEVFGFGNDIDVCEYS